MARPDTHCMGGFSCRRRDDCAHHLSENRDHVVERMCSKGTLDAWVPVDAEGLTMARMKPGQGLLAARKLADRPGGVTAKEFAADAGMGELAARQALTRYARGGALTERKGIEHGNSVCRFWTDAAVAAAYQFDSGYQAKIADRIFEVLRQHGTLTARELAAAIGWHIRTTHMEAKTLAMLGKIEFCEDLAPTGQVQHRFFATPEGKKAWLAVPENRIENQRAAREASPEGKAAAAERARYARKKAERLGHPIPERVRNAPDRRQSAKRVDADTVRANEVASAIQAKKKDSGGSGEKKRPAHKLGELRITKETKITRIPAPLGRYESRDRVIGGFATKRIGEYEGAASSWAEAACS